VVEGDEGVGLAPAEGGAELDHRLSALARQALQDVLEEALQLLGEVGLAEELVGVAVLRAGRAPDHVVQLGGEGALVELAGADVGVGGGQAPPGGEGVGTGSGLGLGRSQRPPVTEGLEEGRPLPIPHRLQDPRHVVQGPVDVLLREVVLVGPAVADLGHLVRPGDGPLEAPAQELLKDLLLAQEEVLEVDQVHRLL
jgi:hypothetical protein